MSRPNGTSSAKIIQVIETIALRGEGTEEDNCRQVRQYWSLEGDLLAEHDPCEKRKKYDVKQTEAVSIDPRGNGYCYDFGQEEGRNPIAIQPGHTENFLIQANHDKKTLTFVPKISGSIIEVGPEKTELLGQIIQALVQLWQEMGTLVRQHQNF